MPQISQPVAGGLPSRRRVNVMMAALRAMGQHGMADGMRIFGYRDTAHCQSRAAALNGYRAMFRNAMVAAPAVRLTRADQRDRAKPLASLA